MKPRSAWGNSANRLSRIFGRTTFRSNVLLRFREISRTARSLASGLTVSRRSPATSRDDSTGSGPPPGWPVIRTVVVAASATAAPSGWNVTASPESSMRSPVANRVRWRTGWPLTNVPLQLFGSST
jgi:hypothetical protein